MNLSDVKGDIWAFILVQLIHYRGGSGTRNPGFNFLWFWSQRDGGSYLITSFLIVVKRSGPMVGPVHTVVLGVISSCPG